MSNIWLDQTSAEILSHDLRHSEELFMVLRRYMVWSLMIAIACMAYISLFQLGLIKHLIDPPFSRMNADKVDSAYQAYQMFSMPDAVIGLTSYGVTLMLVAAGGPHRANTASWIVMLMAAKIIFDLINAARLSWTQWTDHRSFCFWCLLAAIATLVTACLAFPESKAALMDAWGKTK